MNPSFFKVFKNLDQVVRARLQANFFRKLGTNIAVPFMTIYLASYYGNELAGLVVVFILVSGACVNLYGGFIIEKINPQTVVRFAEFFHIICLVLMTLVAENHFLLCIFYLLKNIFFSLSVSAGEKLVVDCSKKDERATVYTLNNVLHGLSTPVGVLLGGFLYAYGIRYLLLVATLASVCVAIIYMMRLPNTSNIKDDQCDVGLTPTKEHLSRVLLRNNKILFLLIAVIFVLVIEFSFLQYFAVKISQVEVFDSLWLEIDGVQAFSILRAEDALIGIIFATFFLKFIQKLNRPITIAASIFLLATGFLCLLNNQNFLMLMLLVAMISLLSTAINPVLQSLYVNNIGNHYSGVFLSLYSLTGRVANIVAATILIFSQTLSNMAISLFIFSIGLLAAVLVLSIGRHLNFV